MPWTKKDYPDSMKNLDAKVRNKAIDIANAILEEGEEKDEGIIIATSISRAKDWAANRNGKEKNDKAKTGVKKKEPAGRKKSASAGSSKDEKSSSRKSGPGKAASKKSSTSGKRKTDVKEHGKDQYVIPVEDEWAVKEEGEERRKIYRTKKEAISKATAKAKKSNATVTVKSKGGRIAKRTSYNPRNKSRSKQ